MLVEKVVVVDDQAVEFKGTLTQDESDLVIGVGLNYLIRAGVFPRITEALAAAKKEEEAAKGFEFPEAMKRND